MPSAAMDEPIAIVVPSKRPGMLHRVQRMLHEQAYQGETVLIPIPDHDRPGLARNAGMRAAKGLGIRLVSFWDDDDFYGPGFLREQFANWQPGRIVGKTFGFIAFNGGVVYFPLLKNSKTHSLLIGGSIFGDVNEMPEWSDSVVGEDGQFSVACREKGLETYVSSGRHFVYSRLGEKAEHTFKASDAYLWYMAGDRGVPTDLTVEEAMVAETPSGRAVQHKGWLGRERLVHGLHA